MAAKKYCCCRLLSCITQSGSSSIPKESDHTENIQEAAGAVGHGSSLINNLSTTAAKKYCRCRLFSCITQSGSSSIPKESDHTQNIREAAGAVGHRSNLINNLPTMAAKKCCCFRLFSCIAQSGSSSVPKESDQTENTREAAGAVAHPSSIYIVAQSGSSSVPKESEHTGDIREAAGAVCHRSSFIIPQSGSSSVRKQSDHTKNIRPHRSSLFNNLSTMPAKKCCCCRLFSCIARSESSRVSKDLANNIRKTAAAVDIKNANADHNTDLDAELNALSNYITQLLEFIKEKKTADKPSMPNRDYWRDSPTFTKFMTLFSPDSEPFKDFTPGSTVTIVQGFLETMGTVDMVAAGFLAVANILERYEKVQTNKEECLSLLNDMNMLIQHVKQLQKRIKLKKQMEVSIKQAIVMIVEASILCCTQIDASKFAQFFSTEVDEKELGRFQQKLIKMYAHLQNQITLCIYDAIEERKAQLQKRGELQYRKHPVDIENDAADVDRLLELVEGDIKSSLERLQTVSINRKALLRVLDELGALARHVMKLQQRPELREGMEASINKAITLIEEVSIICSTQIDSSKCWKFLWALGNKKELVHIQRKIERMHRQIDREMDIYLYDGMQMRLPVDREMDLYLP